MITHTLKCWLGRLGLSLCCLTTASLARSASEPKITSPKEIIGFNIGDDYHMANYTQISTMWKKWASESDRIKLVSIGNTAEGRAQFMCIISSPENLKNLDRYREISVKLAHAEGLTDDEAHKLADEGKAVVWIDGGLHASESVNSQQLAELVYQMVSKTDKETLRFLNDVILLAPIANPDGVEVMANWYMRNEDEKQRTFAGVPRLYNKYVGHDNNRDSIMANMPETINQNRVLFIDWIPQIMYNTHQTGPIGSIVFISPFRDPFNYNFDPLIPLGVQELGTFMHMRLVAKGKGGSAMRSAAPYSTWFNGGMRTATYFHNQIGILTEIVGGPNPTKIPLVPEKQLPSGDWPLPIAPQIWHYRQSIDYDIEIARAALDYASRNRETLLYNIYEMGQHSIDRGSKDSWTITPKRIKALTDAAKERDPKYNPDAPTVGGEGAFVNPTIPSDLYDIVLHDPAKRDPRGYILPSDQDDFPTAVKFVNVLLKAGVTVHKATDSFQVGGKTYPAGSYVVKSAQAFRPEVLDMFEPQDHPTDLIYPGGPPKPPYDITGWTPVKQMGVAYDRILDGFDGPFAKLSFDMEKPAPAKVSGSTKPAGFLVSHKINDSFILTNRLLKANCPVYWLKDEQTIDGRGLGTGTLWIPATAISLPILQKAAKELGVASYGLEQKPAGEAVQLHPVRIGLVDLYGGVMPTGWLRWMFEQYEFPFEIVYPTVLDAGNLKASYDVLVFPSDTYSVGARGGNPAMIQYMLANSGTGSGGSGGRYQPAGETIPEEFRS
ncbi:MAG TPA: M14 metallopeptidase family protein, partial [Opitutaceae bacterium]|nr:M14 metallopeptidase family protein [Opitutaceae bacterium]